MLYLYSNPVIAGFLVLRRAFWLRHKFRFAPEVSLKGSFFQTLLKWGYGKVGDGLKLNNRLILQTTALGLLLVASSIGSLGLSAPYAVPDAPVVEEIETNERMTVEQYVKNYFSDIPVMVEVARCESKFRQHDKDGGVLRGEVNSLDRGVMQINEFYHDEDSKKLGYDILTIEGNTAYARHLFEKYGLKPWLSSSKCWGSTTAYVEYKSLASK